MMVLMYGWLTNWGFAIQQTTCIWKTLLLDTLCFINTSGLLVHSVLQEAFGQINSHELKDGGVDILVTEENKHEYIDLMLRWRLDRGVARQMESFKKGFCEVMPVNLLYNFDAQELEFLTAGTLEIDADDWKAHTEYRNGERKKQSL